jgi:muramidase (phage lysozyme)
MTPKQQAFLDLVAWSEGTSSSPLTRNDGYDVIVTGVDGPSVFTDYARHPFEAGGNVTVRKGPLPLVSTAAGRYQILVRIWRFYKTQLRLTDFSPASQDSVALKMIAERGALPLIQLGDIHGAIAKCANLWASFPGNSYGQGGRTLEAMVSRYAQISQTEPGPTEA